MFARLGDAAPADFNSLARGKDDIHHTDVFEFLEDTSRLVAQPGLLAQASQRFPQHIRQEADENVRQHTIFFLVPDGPNVQVAFVNPKRRFGFGQLDVG